MFYGAINSHYRTDPKCHRFMTDLALFSGIGGRELGSDCLNDTHDRQ